jgi:hypothetical protein
MLICKPYPEFQEITERDVAKLSRVVTRHLDSKAVFGCIQSRGRSQKRQTYCRQWRPQPNSEEFLTRKFKLWPPNVSFMQYEKRHKQARMFWRTSWRCGRRRSTLKNSETGRSASRETAHEATILTWVRHGVSVRREASSRILDPS